MGKESSHQRMTNISSPHPRAFSPLMLVVLILVSSLGSIIGIQTLVTLGVTPSTSIIGALVAMAIARLPIYQFTLFRSVHAQNLVQTSMSSATFGAAISLLAPLGIAYVMEMPELIMPILVGVSLAMLWDAFLLYRMFDSPVFPASGAWPLGMATAEVIKTTDRGGYRTITLICGVISGFIGSLLGLPMSAAGIAFIGGFAAMLSFAAGLLLAPCLYIVFALDISTLRMPEGILVGAGMVAALQIGLSMYKRKKAHITIPAGCHQHQIDQPGASSFRALLGLGSLGYLFLAMILALGTGLFEQLSLPMLIGFVVFGTISALLHELIVGIAAMNTGWMPAFGVALLSLVIGIWIGFPVKALVVLTAFTSATGPAFADMGYDLKAGYILRGDNRDPIFEQRGRREQMIAGMLGFGVAIIAVLLTWRDLFAHNLFAPVNLAYAAAIKTSIDQSNLMNFTSWVILGALLQVIGGTRGQLGIMLATGLLIAKPTVGWMVLLGLICRLWVKRKYRNHPSHGLESFAGGMIAGDALCSIMLSAHSPTVGQSTNEH
ncbi:OPT/YSL family transporter [Photorhabdus namnaonensis]|uniref:OPT oligopeptide transporter protein n=1 Tax=Photorhabdus namnaonensis TaxID=1851568 RepID=A0A1B8YB86_9GAMM|nr:OPT/YSL family transporter [Photorhabdus namnaonensis]OCA52396.1 OPT oligopeptide transporter protein [Photorhabdus namnaonensis]